jgi:uncharacterized membrane protein
MARLPLSAYARAVTLAAHVLLIAGIALWSASLLGYIVAALLLPAVPGLLRGRPYTYAWSSLLLTFYCAGLLAEGVAMPARQPVAWTLAAVAAVEFSALVLFVRLRSRERRAAAAAE